MSYHRSLFIVTVPRSASTALEQACTFGLSSLNFNKKGEILNGDRNRLKVPQYAKKEQHFSILKQQCEKHAINSVVRDVIQPNFVTQNIEWIKDRFNVLLLMRPVEEIMFSRRRLGWKMPKKTVKRYQKMLSDLPDDDRFQRIEFYDFVQDNPQYLVQILQNWYPECKSFEYMDRTFANKKRQTLIGLEQNGIKTKKK